MGIDVSVHVWRIIFWNVGDAGLNTGEFRVVGTPTVKSREQGTRKIDLVIWINVYRPFLI